MIKLYPLRIVHTSFYAYGSSKITKKERESICRSHLTNNEWFFPLFFKKDGFFARLPIN